jgi:hypothetical protein
MEAVSITVLHIAETGESLLKSTTLTEGILDTLHCLDHCPRCGVKVLGIGSSGPYKEFSTYDTVLQPSFVLHDPDYQHSTDCNCPQNPFMIKFLGLYCKTSYPYRGAVCFVKHVVDLTDEHTRRIRVDCTEEDLIALRLYTAVMNKTSCTVL